LPPKYALAGLIYGMSRTKYARAGLIYGAIGAKYAVRPLRPKPKATPVDNSFWPNQAE
jgi:hypothetical protein